MITMTKDCDCHEQKKERVVDKRARRKLIIACVLSVMFITAEIVGGYLANSLAIVSDATHLLADLASFIISIIALSLSSRTPTKKLSFGWHRAEMLGALVAIYLLWIITCVMCYVAVGRVINTDFDVDATIMLITASCGVAFNIVMMLTLHPGSHGHSHTSKNDEESDHSWLSDSDKKQLTPMSELAQNDKYTDYGGVSNSDQNNHADKDTASENVKHFHNGSINITASFLHVLGDLLQSIGVLIAAAIIYFKPEWKLADPLCTFVFSIIVMVTTFPVSKDIFYVLMEGTPKNLDFQKVQENLKRIPEVEDIHDLRIWSLSLDKTVLSVHIAVEETADSMAVLKQATRLIRTQYDITETNIQIEYYIDNMSLCTHCNDLKD